MMRKQICGVCVLLAAVVGFVIGGYAVSNTATTEGPRDLLHILPPVQHEWIDPARQVTVLSDAIGFLERNEKGTVVANTLMAVENLSRRTIIFRGEPTGELVVRVSVDIIPSVTEEALLPGQRVRFDRERGFVYLEQ